MLGTEGTEQEILPDSSQTISNVKIESVTNDVNPQDLNKQQLDLSVPTPINHFEEEIEDEESEDEKYLRDLTL